MMGVSPQGFTSKVKVLLPGLLHDCVHNQGPEELSLQQEHLIKLLPSLHVVL